MLFKKQPPACPVCTQTLMQGLEVPVVKFMGAVTVEEFVCSNACKREYVERNLRRGM